VSQSISLVVAPTTQNVRLVAERTAALAATVLEAQEAARVELCLVEALNNVVEHAYANVDAAAAKMAIDVDLKDAELTIRIVDSGASAPAGLFDAQPELIFDVDNLDNLPEGGMGLFIIHEVMDEVKYTSAGDDNTLLMRKSCEASTS